MSLAGPTPKTCSPAARSPRAARRGRGARALLGPALCLSSLAWATEVPPADLAVSVATPVAAAELALIEPVSRAAVRSPAALSPAPGAPGEVDPADEEGPAASSLVFSTMVLGERQSDAADSSLLTRVELQERGAADLAAALQGLPGITLRRHPKSGASLYLRGLGGGHLVLLDGVPVEEIYGGGYDLGALAVLHLDTVEVQRGVPSLLYGPGAAGGIVRLATPARAARPTLRLQLEAGGLHRDEVQDGQAAFAGALPLGPLTLQLAAARSVSDGFEIADSWRPNARNAEFHEDGGLRTGSDHDRRLLFGKASLRRGAWRVDLLGHLLDQERGIPPHESAGVVRYWRFDSYTTGVAALSGAYHPSAPPAGFGLLGAEASLTLNRHADQLDDYEDSRYQRLTTDPRAWFASSELTGTSVGGRLASSWRTGRRARLDLAGDFRFDDSHQRELRVGEAQWGPWDRYASTRLSLAAEQTLLLGPVKLLAGLGGSGRRLVVEEHQDQRWPVADAPTAGWEARVQADWAATDDLRLLLGLGRRLRPPTLKELFSGVLGGNSALQAEVLHRAELSLTWAPAALPRTQVRLRGYGDLLADRIAHPRDRYVNAGGATVLGAELEGEFSPAPWLGAGLGYAFTRGRDEELDRPLDFVPEHAGTAFLRLLAPWGSVLRLELTGQGRAAGAYVDASLGGWIEQRYPAYVLLDAVLRQPLPLGRAYPLLLTLRGENLTDEAWAAGSLSPLAGRRLWAGLELEI